MAISFHLIFVNKYMNRFIIQNNINKSLLKIQPLSERFIDPIIQEKVKEYNGRFCFWQEATSNIWSKHEVQKYVGQIKLNHNEYRILTSLYMGIDCERLLISTFDCSRYCYGYHEPCLKQMMIDANHIMTFLNYLIEGFEILSNKGIQHGDIRLANILVYPTTEELISGTIQTSLPLIIDFGLSNLVDQEIAIQSNVKGIVNLLTSCKHGMLRLDSFNDNWLTAVVAKSQRSIIEKQLACLALLFKQENVNFSTIKRACL